MRCESFLQIEFDGGRHAEGQTVEYLDAIKASSTLPRIIRHC
jgi:hypothetical protein